MTKLTDSSEHLQSISDFSKATDHIIAHGDRISALES